MKIKKHEKPWSLRPAMLVPHELLISKDSHSCTLTMAWYVFLTLFKSATALELLEIPYSQMNKVINTHQLFVAGNILEVTFVHFTYYTKCTMLQGGSSLYMFCSRSLLCAHSNMRGSGGKQGFWEVHPLYRVKHLYTYTYIHVVMN